MDGAVSVAPLLKHGNDPAGPLELPGESVVRGAWQGHICSVELQWSLEGGKKSTIVASPWTPETSYPLASHSGAMGCHGDFLFPTSKLFKGILLLLCSL